MMLFILAFTTAPNYNNYIKNHNDKKLNLDTHRIYNQASNKP